MSIIEEKANKIAKQHIEILELECKRICEKYNCSPKDLIIEYHSNTQIKINVKAINFEIMNQFIFRDDDVKNCVNSMQIIK